MTTYADHLANALIELNALLSEDIDFDDACAEAASTNAVKYADLADLYAEQLL
jgi:hypothetical protein